MKTVVSASRRTDIPAFYLDWLINGISNGYVEVQNPFYKRHTYHVDLTPDRIEWIVFWSRNYGKFIKKRSIFNEYKLFFHFTILSHNRYLENTKFSLNKIIRQMEQLVYFYGADHIIWRYDPIVLWRSGTDIETNFNDAEFKFLCSVMGSLGVRRCYFSFVSPYKKFKRRFNLHSPHLELIYDYTAYSRKIVGIMSEHAAEHHIQLFSCCNEYLNSESIQKGSCISGSVLNSLSGKKIVSEAKSPSRPQCGCTRSVDIGSYRHHPCYYGCIYCYANPVIKSKPHNT